MLQDSRPFAVEPLVVAPDIVLARARVHEITGPARPFFALAVASRTAGPVLWIQTRWTTDRLMGDGVRALIDPGRLVIARTRTLVEILWAAEEALRAGVIPLVVAELPALPGLTATRRLHLAAEAGAERGMPPLGLLLTPEPGGVPGIETRWHLRPNPGWAEDGIPRWRLTRQRARMAPPRAWTVAARRGRIVVDAGQDLDA